MHCNSTVTSTGNFVASRSYCIFTVVTFYSVGLILGTVVEFCKTLSVLPHFISIVGQYMMGLLQPRKDGHMPRTKNKCQKYPMSSPYMTFLPILRRKYQGEVYLGELQYSIHILSLVILDPVPNGIPATPASSSIA